MRIISRRALREFSIKHPLARQPLDDWYKLVSRVEWHTPADLKKLFRSADILTGNRVVFNIGGNSFRLVVKIEYGLQMVFVRFIGTHAEYDRIDATVI